MKKIFKRNGRLIMLFMLAMLMVLTACSPKQSKPEDTKAAETKTEAVEQKTEEKAETKEKSTEQTEPEKKHSDEDVVTLGGRRHLAPGEKDGYYCSVILYVWEPLLRQNDLGEPAPSLAETWEMSEDGKVWTFHLREGVKFHDGTDFNADAVVANFDRMSKEVKPSGYYPLDINFHYPNLDSYEKVDDYTFKLTFKEPSPTQPYRMVNFGSAIFSPNNFDENGDFNGFAIGTGPFMIKENVKDDYVLLERNDNYWGEKAKLKNIKVRSIPDADTRFSALKSGEIQGTLDLNSLTPALADEIKKDDNLELATSKSTMIRFLIPNGTKAPFNDMRMKQALSLALNRQDIVDVVHYGYAKPTTNILNYACPFYKDIAVHESMEEAKALAKEVLGDFTVDVDFYINAKDPAQKTEAELIAPWLKEIGINANILPVEYSVMKEKLKAGEFGLARSQQGLPNSDASTIFGRFMVTTGDHNKNYSLGYDIEEVNKLMADASSSLDIEQIKKDYNELQELSTTTLPVIPLFFDENIMGYSKELKNYDAQLYGLNLPLIEWAD